MIRSLSRTFFDVVVVGSGPAGSSAALRLAQHGVRVAIVEKAAPPRYKTCGGGIVRRAMRLLPIDVDDAVERPCHTAELHLLDADLHFATRRTEPIIAMTMRATFDFLLLSAAKDAGVDVQPSCALLDVVLQDDEVELITSRGSLLTRFVVAADGARSAVASKAGWQDSRRLIPALEYEVSVNDQRLERLADAARFDFGLVPCGYAWVFPKKAHLSIGVLSMQRGSLDLHALCARYLKRLGLDHVEGLERHGFVIPVRPRQGPFVQRRVLLTGDAAGFADPLTGEGISFAIQSGQLAAQALLDGAFDEGGVRQAYQEALAKSILPELRWGRVLASVTYDYPRLRAWFLRRQGQRLSEVITDVLMGERTYRSIFRNPLSYLKLLRLWGRAHRGMADEAR
jgi:geranylgeranyl reductase family protein